MPPGVMGPRNAALMRIGAVCAVVGSVLSVAAGIGFGNLTNEHGTEFVLRAIAAEPRWYWPTVHLAFITGACMWLGAFVAIAALFERGLSRALGWLGVAVMTVGAAVHVVDSSISGFGLASLAFEWASSSDGDRATLLRTGDSLLYVLTSTWPNVHGFFHGVPFILTGAAVATSRQYPAWLGSIAVTGGAGSLAGGALMFYATTLGSERFFIVFAQIVSLWMIAMAPLLWRAATLPRSVEAVG